MNDIASGHKVVMELFLLAITISLIIALAPLKTKPSANYLSPPAISRTIDPTSADAFIETSGNIRMEGHDSVTPIDTSLGRKKTQEFLYDELDEYYPQDMSSDPLPAELVVSSQHEQVECFHHEGRQYLVIITADSLIIREDS